MVCDDVGADIGATTSTSPQDDCSVRVALRIRPQIAREKLEMCRVCTSVAPGESQVLLGADRAFTFDHVFDSPTPQPAVYEQCVARLVDGAFDGYNATVLAYGQTGSGKTFTMGTGFDVAALEQDAGIVPRAARHLFGGVDRRRTDARAAGRAEPVFELSVQFIELYNDEVVDLLDSTRDYEARLRRNDIRIHEDANGEIYVTGVTSVPVKSAEEMLLVLKNGSLGRTTASTNMNAQSSRSHAIFSVLLRQQRLSRFEGGAAETRADGGGGSPDSGLAASMADFEVLTAKFHFVDLAGSERLKRTGASGDRAKEGISINCGLLALGNVISALGDASRKAAHVPYRDSKLTRLLQDSLGGNSRTLMIACVSPSDCDFVETLNTLKYANRAKNITNRVVVNQDKTSRLLGELRAEIQQLKLELLELKQGKRLVGADGSETLNDQYHENVLLQSEVNQLRTRVKALTESAETLKQRNVHLLAEQELNRLYGRNELEGGAERSDDDDDPTASAIRKYLSEIEGLRGLLCESQSTCEVLRRQLGRYKTSANQILSSPTAADMSASCVEPLVSSAAVDAAESVLDAARADVGRLRAQADKAVRRRRARRPSTAEERQPTSDYATEAPAAANSESSPESELSSSGDDDDADDDGSETERDEELESDKCRRDLAELQTEISIKEQLVEELERSQQRLASLRYQYEQKLKELTLRIQETELERDKILADLEVRDPKKSSEEAKRVRAEYEVKLADMRNKLKQVETAEREHQRQLSRQQQDAQRVSRLREELGDMKKVKVDLMRRMKEESKRAKELETRRNKEVAALQKEARRRENEIRNLRAAEMRREGFLRRKEEELAASRRAQRSTAPKRPALSVVGQMARRVLHPSAKTIAPFSRKLAKQRWNQVERNINQVVAQKQTVAQMEQDLERILHQREELCVLIQDALGREQRAPTADERADAAAELDGMRAKLDYMQEQIADAQKAIMEVDESLKDSATSETDAEQAGGGVNKLLDQCQNLAEAKFLMQHLYNVSVSQSLLAATAQAEHRLAKEQTQRLEQQQRWKDQLLDQLVHSEFPQSIDEIHAPRKSAGEAIDKARRRTATPDELLYPLQLHDFQVRQLETVAEGSRTRDCSPERDGVAHVGASAAAADWPSVATDRRGAVPPPTPPKPAVDIGALRSAAVATAAVAAQSTPTTPRASPKQFRRPVSHMFAQPQQPASPTPLRRQPNSSADLAEAPPPPPPNAFSRGVPMRNTIATHGIPRRMVKSDCSESLSSNSNSPRLGRKLVNQGKNVFHRLMPSAISDRGDAHHGKLGRIRVHVGRGKRGDDAPLYNERTAEGHLSAVMDVDALQSTLISGSKDRYAKVWDLETNAVVHSLGPHPNNVECVRLLRSDDRLALTVSLAQVRVWDLRSGACVVTLNSNGLTQDGEAQPATPSRQTASNVSDPPVAAVDLVDAERVLLVAASSAVRIWDLRGGYASVGKLDFGAGGARSSVSALTTTALPDGGRLVATGSRDHVVRLYRLSEGAARGGVHAPDAELSPPHYDGVTALVTAPCRPGAPSRWLFSASRDQALALTGWASERGAALQHLMKWDLENQCRLEMQANAHGSWIMGLALMPAPFERVLASACRLGVLKLWDARTFCQLGAVNACVKDQSINRLASNGRHLFAACSDGSVSMWRPKSEKLHFDS